MTAQWFSHSGDLGDIIYSLPTIRAAGGGSLRIFDAPGKTAHGMTEDKVNRIRPLLVAQPYIDEVIWSPGGPDHSLNGFRDHWREGVLADMHLATHGFGWQHRRKAWLHVDPIETYEVVIHRSARYRNGRFPWPMVLDEYDGQMGFVGHIDEHKTFCFESGKDIPFIEAPDFLTLARVIAGSKLYIGNQSSPLAVAHGLKHSTIMEICPGASQHLCVFQQANCIICWDEKLELPEV